LLVETAMESCHRVARLAIADRISDPIRRS
jgi:hypothetical protein